MIARGPKSYPGTLKRKDRLRKTAMGKKTDRKYWQTLASASVMGLHIVSGTVVGLVMGIYLDKWLQTKPWLTILFLIFGIIAGFMNMFRELRKIDDQGAQKDKPAA